MGSEGMKVTQISATLGHGARVERYTYTSEALGETSTKFHVVVPMNASKVPVVYYLSGLTCDDTNAVTKGEVARAVAKHGVAMVFPDTSPRGAGAPNEDDTYSFGTGAGFYVNATKAGFEAYQMATFVEEELPTAVEAALGDAVDVKNAGITGHSMGGHGALTIALRNPDRYRSVSAFAPITNPCITPWGIAALGGYLGDDRDVWKTYDATELIKSGAKLPPGTLIDQGTEDEFLEKELLANEFSQVCKQHSLDVVVNMREGYSHGYFFVATFMDDHVAHHAKVLLS